jgi:hypothetical protein
MIGGRIGTFFSGLSGRARGAVGAGFKLGVEAGSGVAQGAAGASFLSSPQFRKAVARNVSFTARHPMLLGAGIGGIGGFVGSGRELGGALVGAGLGAMGGRAGWTKYDVGSTGARTRMAARLGRRITKAIPDIAAAYGPQRMKMRTWARSMSGHARNVGGKVLGAQAVGKGMMLGAGLVGGVGWGMTTNMVGSSSRGVANTFGSQMNAVYGNAFSGMGNGTITGY